MSKGKIKFLVYVLATYVLMYFALVHGFFPFVDHNTYKYAIAFLLAPATFPVFFVFALFAGIFEFLNPFIQWVGDIFFNARGG